MPHKCSKRYCVRSVRYWAGHNTAEREKILQQDEPKTQSSLQLEFGIVATKIANLTMETAKKAENIQELLTTTVPPSFHSSLIFNGDFLSDLLLMPVLALMPHRSSYGRLQACYTQQFYVLIYQRDGNPLAERFKGAVSLKGGLVSNSLRNTVIQLPLP